MAGATLQANFSANTAGFSQGVSVLKQKLTELNTQLEQNKQEIKSANSEIRSYQKELTQLKQSTNNGATATAEQAKRMRELQDNIAVATSRLGVLRTAQQDLRSEVNSVNNELRNQNNAIGEVSDSAVSMGEILKANLWSAGIQTAVNKLVQSLKTASSYCYSVGTSFEAAMSQVEAISGASGSSLDALKNKAMELGATTKFSASEAAAAMNYMAMAGWDAQQMLEGISGVMSLAAASGGDLAETSDIVTDAITAFGLQAEDVAHFSDVLAAASANANTNVSMMGETFKYCAPIAGALGFSVEDVAEAIGIMANSGIKSTMAGTALRTVLTKLSDGVKIVGENIGEVSIQTSNADGSMRSLQEILTDLRTAFSGLTEAEKSQNAETIAGKYALSGFLALMNAGADDVNKLRTAIENCDNSSANMAETMTKNTAGAVTILKSSLETLGINIYEKFGENMKSEIEKITDFVSSLADRIDGGEFDAVFQRMADAVGDAADQLIDFAVDVLPGLIEGFANLIKTVFEYKDAIAVAAVGMVTLKAALKVEDVVVKLSNALDGAAASTTALTTATKTLKLTFGIVTAAITAAVGVYTTYINSLDDCNEKNQELISSSKAASEAQQDYAEKSSCLEDVKKRYDEIYSSTEDTKTKEEQLKELQSELEKQFGTMASQIDLVTGSYNAQITALDKLIDKNNEYSKTSAELSYNNALEAEKQQTMVSFGSFDKAGDYVVDLIRSGSIGSTTKMESTGFLGMGDRYQYFSGSYEQRIKDFEYIVTQLSNKYAETGDNSYLQLANKFNTALDELNSGKEQKDVAEKVLDGINGNKNYDDIPVGPFTKEQMQSFLSGSSGGSSAGGGSSGSSSSSAKTYDESEYTKQKSELKWRLDMNYITEAEYYSQLANLRDKYLEEGTEKWRAATLEIYKYRTKSADSAADYTKKSTSNALTDIKNQYNAAISAIDDEIKSRNQAKEDKDLQAQIDAVAQQLEYGRLDDYSRKQLENKKAELEQQKADTEFERQKQKEKDALNAVYTMAEEAYTSGSAQLEKALQTASIVFNAVGRGASQTASAVNTVTNNNLSFALSAVSQTADQIAAAVIKAISSSI